MIVPLAYSDPFGTGIPRPYLVLHVVGPNGAEGDVLGIVDSGADSTCLPLDYASLMGYASTDLHQEPMVQAGGTTNCYVATGPSTAWVVGLESVTFTIQPTFVDGALSALWGRDDLFTEFGIAFNEPGQAFTLIVPD